VKIYLWLLLLLLVWLQWRVWQGPNGIEAYHALRAQIASQQRENKALHSRNTALASETADLHSGLAALEERARVELGLIKPGETFYQVIE
jgi:cell division protein FtsB